MCLQSINSYYFFFVNCKKWKNKGKKNLILSPIQYHEESNYHYTFFDLFFFALFLLLMNPRDSGSFYTDWSPIFYVQIAWEQIYSSYTNLSIT